MIGINGRGSFEKRGRVNVGVGYAISINQIKHFLGHLKAGRIVDHATLGATVASDPDDGRVLVSDILEDSDAYRRGLRYGDEIVRFGGREIRTVNAFKNVLGIFPKNWQTTLSYRRDGQTVDTWVRLAGVHGTEELIEKVMGRPAVPPSPKEPPRKPDEKPDDKPAPDQPEKHPQGANPHAKEKPLPDVVKKVFEARHGYANYHFNKVNRDRVWNALVARGDFATVGGPWTLKGDVLTGGEAMFEIADKSVGLSLPGGQLKLDVKDSLTEAVEPRGSGGMMAALYLWRRLLVRGPSQFGELSYLGLLPLPGDTRGPVDVLHGIFGGVETLFYVDTEAGALLRVVMYLSADDDPCELILSEYAEHQGRMMPRKLEVRYGDQSYGAYRLKQLELKTSGGQAQ